MSYIVERDWDHGNLRCVAIMTDMGHRCGYVGVPHTHPLSGVAYNQESDALKVLADAAANKPVGKRGAITVFCMALAGEVSPKPEQVFDVHGSLTFSDGDGQYPIKAANLWWFGFDCSHCDDAPDTAYANAEFKNQTRPRFKKHGTIRTLEYVASECESLARQLQAVKG